MAPRAKTPRKKKKTTPRKRLHPLSLPPTVNPKRLHSLPQPPAVNPGQDRTYGGGVWGGVCAWVRVWGGVCVHVCARHRGLAASPCSEPGTAPMSCVCVYESCALYPHLQYFPCPHRRFQMCARIIVCVCVCVCVFGQSVAKSSKGRCVFVANKS